MMMRMRRMRRDLPLNRLNQLNSSSPRIKISMSGDLTKLEIVTQTSGNNSLIHFQILNIRKIVNNA